MGLLFGYGATTLIQISKARNEVDKVNNYFKTSLYICLGLSVVFILFSNIFITELSYLLGATKENIDLVIPYFRFVAIMAPSMVLSPLLQSLTRSSGLPRVAMISLLISGVANVVLDYIFIYSFDLGTMGAGLATCIASYLGLIYILKFFFGKNRLYSYKGKFTKGVIVDIIKSGLPSFGYELGLGVTVYLLNNSLSYNVLAVSSYSVISYVSIVVLNLYNGVCNSLHPLLSFNYGASNFGKNNTLIKYGFISIVLIFVFAYLSIFFYPEQIINIFTKPSEETLVVGVQGLRLYPSMYLFAGINVLLVTYLQCYNKEKYSNIAAILRSGSLIFIILPIMRELFEIKGIWLSLTVVEIISGFFIIYFYFKVRKGINNE